MNSLRSVPVTAATFTILTLLLSGGIAYDATSGVMDGDTSIMVAAGDVVTSPLGGDDSVRAPKH